MSHGIRESRLLPPENIVRQQVVLFKGVAQKVFSHIVGVDLHSRIDAHDILHEIQITEGHPGLDGVGGNAAVRPEHIVHIQLVHPLRRLLLESFRRGGEVRVLIAKQLIGNFTGHQHPDIRFLMNGLAAKVHSHAGPDGGDVIGPQKGDDLLQGVQHLLPGHEHLGMLRADIVGYLPGIL